MSLILVTLTAYSHSNFERLNISFKENKLDGFDPNSEAIVFERKEEELYGFWQTVDIFTHLLLEIRPIYLAFVKILRSIRQKMS